MNQSTKLIQKLKQRFKSDNFCYRKYGRAITKWGAIEKSKKIISHFDGSNNIFANCIQTLF